ncbi:MAG: deoxyribodipyrimidine photo-lyase [Ectothiorhodospiraceae bacterium]
MTTTLVWLRRDLRLSDNPALAAGAAEGAVLPVYIHAPEEEDPWQPGAASRWWLHYSLAALRDALAEHGLPLILRTADSSLEALHELCRETGASRVTWNRLYEPAVIARDRRVKQALRQSGITAESYNAALLHEPWTVSKGDGGHYQKFTPFRRALERRETPERPTDLPALTAPASTPVSEPIEALALLPRIRWDTGFQPLWTPGEVGARRRLDAFVEQRLDDYPQAREQPAVAGTSGLSPHLHFGEIGPRQVHWAVQDTAPAGDGATAFLGEIAWREFAHHLLFHCPTMPDDPLDTRFRAFPWREDPEPALKAWQAGTTGIPLVDAGMRELWATGWMHNRLRMVVGSLLTKNLRIPWQRGEAWFWDTLVDADLANNSMGWQWIQGCGADAAPYFRIFSPLRQGERFDPEGHYVRQWVPELAGLPAKHIHSPWQAPAGVLRQAGVRLGRDYPEPIVDLSASRKQALDAYQAIR